MTLWAAGIKTTPKIKNVCTVRFYGQFPPSNLLAKFAIVKSLYKLTPFSTCLAKVPIYTVYPYPLTKDYTFAILNLYNRLVILPS